MKLEPIDTSTTAGKAEVMRLAAEGRRVAQRGIRCTEPFYEMRDGYEIRWNWESTSYAIIAERVGPNELFAVIGTFGEAEVVGITLSGVECYGAKLGRTVVRYVREDLAGGAA